MCSNAYRCIYETGVAFDRASARMAIDTVVSILALAIVNYFMPINEENRKRWLAMLMSVAAYMLLSQLVASISDVSAIRRELEEVKSSVSTCNRAWLTVLSMQK